VDTTGDIYHCTGSVLGGTLQPRILNFSLMQPSDTASTISTVVRSASSTGGTVSSTDSVVGSAAPSTGGIAGSVAYSLCSQEL